MKHKAKRQIDPVTVSHPLQHYISTNKKYRKYKAVHLPFSWFTRAIEQMDKSTALTKAVQSADYYRQ